MRTVRALHGGPPAGPSERPIVTHWVAATSNDRKLHANVGHTDHRDDQLTKRIVATRRVRHARIIGPLPGATRKSQMSSSHSDDLSHACRKRFQAVADAENLTAPCCASRRPHTVRRKRQATKEPKIEAARQGLSWLVTATRLRQRPLT